LWLVADHILGTGHHRADVYWHLDASWTLERASARHAGLTHADGLWATIASTAGSLTEFRGDADGLGWCAPVYGRVMASPTLRFSESAQAPLSVVTAIGAARCPVELSVDAAPVITEREDEWHRVAVTGTHGEERFVALFAAPYAAEVQASGDIPRDSGRRRTVQRVTSSGAELATDARLAILRISQCGEPLSLDLIDATVAAWTGPGALTVGPLASAEDLHLDRITLGRLNRKVEATPVWQGG
jgi:hypothetical protein